MNQQTDSLDNELLNLLQSEFPISETPFLDLGHKLSISEAVSYTHLTLPTKA